MNGAHAFGHAQHEAHPVFQAAAVPVIPLVTVRRQELVR